SVLSTIAQTQRAIRDAAQHDVRLQPIAEQTEAARISIQDIAYALRDYADHIDANPQELERLQSRLAELERLHRKYGFDLLEHFQKKETRGGLEEARIGDTGRAPVSGNAACKIYDRLERCPARSGLRRRSA